jgi:hypothetical protein
MSKKLGEILVEDGRITEPQLQKALKAQLIFGGHLGTSLIELGYVDEETLGETLARAFNVPYATYDVLQNVPYSVVRAIPAKLVEKYRAIPIRVDGKVLQLAMLDPKNLMALDEISFVTGYKIDPWVSPEIRIYQVLEKYYNIPRSQRYITLARELGKLRARSEKIQGSDSGGFQAVKPPVSSEDTAPQPVAVEASPPAEATPPPMPAAPPSPPPPHPDRPAEAAARQPVDHWEKYGYGKSWREFADAMERKATTAASPNAAMPSEAPQAPPPHPPEERAGRERNPEHDLVEASRVLAACESPEEVADVVLSFASRYMERSAFFVIRGDHAVGWDGTGEGFETARIKGLNVPLERDSLFSLLDDGSRHFLGHLPTFPSIRRLFQNLNVPMPKIAFLAPIRVREKLASVLYGDGGKTGDIRDLDLDAFDRLTHKASLALQMLILKNKILSG